MTTHTTPDFFWSTKIRLPGHSFPKSFVALSSVGQKVQRCTKGISALVSAQEDRPRNPRLDDEKKKTTGQDKPSLARRRKESERKREESASRVPRTPPLRLPKPITFSRFPCAVTHPSTGTGPPATD